MRPSCAAAAAAAPFSRERSLIERDEIVGLLFNVSDISETLAKIELLLRGDDGEAEEDE